MSAAQQMSRFFCAVAACVVVAAGIPAAHAADDAIAVQLDVRHAGPRTVEPLTAQRILRDYRIAWTSLSEAFEQNSTAPLDGPFVGNARRWLERTVANQARSGVSQRYLNQNHKLVAVFYAPEGDVLELHDDAQYEVEVLDGGNPIHNQPAIVHYVVVMTPGADRWVVRQLQAVPDF